MKKKYLVIAGIFLIFLIITTILLSFRKKSTTTQKNSPFPTNIPVNQESQQLNNETIEQSSPLTPNRLIPSSSLNLSAIPPLETEDFKLQYSPKLNKVVVEKKTPQAEEQFINWANQNKLTKLVDNPELTLIVDLGKNPDDFNPLIDFLNIFMNMGQGAESPSSTIQTGSTDSTGSTNSTNSTPNSFTYFPQCGDQGDTPLPNGCNLCQAGCGPTAISMIATSYLGGGYDPKAIVNQYRSRGYLLGCDGSRYSDAKQILQSLGLKTTDYLVFNSEKSDTVVPQLKKYLNAGWTFFTLASFCESACGHYFWITDIDDKGNIFAYDPAYGRYEIPYNENTRYPYPLYRLAFGVKR